MSIFVENWESTKALRASEQKEKTIGAELAQVHRQIELAIEEKNNLLREPREAGLGAAADAFLAGKRVDVSSVGERLRKLQREADVISLALTKQQAITAEQRGKFSADVCNHPQNRAAYIQIQKRLAAAVFEVATVNALEETFMAELYAAGVSSVPFRPMRIKEIGTLADVNSRASAHGRELEQFCPEVLR
jgi:hypothetical protein